MATLEELRQKYPMYNDLSDEQFIGGFHKKFYSDMPIEELYKKLNFSPEPPPPTEATQLEADVASFGRAARAFPGSAKGAATQLWDVVTHAPEVISNIRQLGWKGVVDAVGADLKEHYGSIERARKTFETDPFRFITDISLPLTAGGSILAKLTQWGGKLGRTVLPEIAAKTADVPVEALRTAGEAGRLGGRTLEGAEYSAALRGQPSPTAVGTQGMPAAQAIGARQQVAPFTQAGQTLRGAGWMPSERRMLPALGALGASVYDPRAAASLPMFSPRAMAATTHTLGAAERAGAEAAGPLAKGAFASGSLGIREELHARAQEALKDKQGLSNEEVKILRAATRTEADSKTLQRAMTILGRRLPTQPTGRVEAEFGQLAGGAPREQQAAAQPAQPPTPELSGETPLPLPGQSRGIGAVPGTVAAAGAPQTMPEPERRQGLTKPQFIAQKMWEGLLAGVKKPGEAIRGELPLEQAMAEPEWGPAMGMSMLGVGAPRGMTTPGTLGMVGGKMKQPATPWAGAAPHLVEPVGATDFHAAISKMQDTPHGGALDPLPPEAYEGKGTHLTPDKTAGYMLDGDNIGAVFKHPDSPHQKIAPSLIADAIRQGGRRLDAFDTMLPHLYGDNGFRAVARIKFDPKEAPPNWNYEAFKKWNDGKPDVVYMVYDPYRSGYRPGDGKLVSSYKEAVELQKAEAAKINQRMEAAEKKFDEIAQSVTGLKRIKEYLTPEELETVTARNTKNLLDVFEQMPGEEMAAVAYSGRAKRGWYRNSAKALVDVFGAADAPRFTALLAAMSPRVSVQYNTINALRTWMEWKRMGSPTERGAILEAMSRGVGGAKGLGSVMESWRLNAVRALSHPDPLSLVISGPKVNSFMRNLGKNVHEVTNDAWMASYAGIKQSRLKGVEKEDPYGYLGTKGPAYVGMSAATRRAAKVLSEKTGDVWTPAEIQETVWSWAKTLKEKALRGGRDASVEKLLKAGDITHAEIANTPDFATLFTQGIYRKILEGGGYGKAVEGLGKGAPRSGAAPSRGPLDPEGTAFAGPAYKRHLLRAGRRLDLSRAPEPE